MAPGAINQPNVEFVNPKFRDEYLSRSSESGGSSVNGPDNPWVWLNAYSRIPVSLNNNKSSVYYLIITVDIINV